MPLFHRVVYRHLHRAYCETCGAPSPEVEGDTIDDALDALAALTGAGWKSVPDNDNRGCYLMYCHKCSQLGKIGP